jgi:hypothetical protein
MRTKAQRFSQGTEVMKIILELFGGQNINSVVIQV